MFPSPQRRLSDDFTLVVNNSNQDMVCADFCGMCQFMSVNKEGIYSQQYQQCLACVNMCDVFMLILWLYLGAVNTVNNAWHLLMYLYSV